MHSKDTEEEQEMVNESIGSGEYFQQSRAWYNEMFLAPIAQSNLFKLSAVLSCFAALVGLVSCMAILPVTERVTIPVSTPNIDSTAAHSVHLAQKGKSADQTILGFFVKEYVLRRESYSFHSYRKNRAFVKSHSDPITFKKYDAIFGARNPKSPAAILGERGERIVRIQRYTLKPNLQPPVAVVDFEISIRGKEKLPKSYWTASFSFYYDSLEVEEQTNPETGELELATQDPVFNVVKYVVSEKK